MVLDSLNSETPNIKDLTLDEQLKSEVVIDLDEIINPETWRSMVNYLGYGGFKYDASQIRPYTEQAATFAQYSPERMTHLGYPQTQAGSEIWTAIKDYLKNRPAPLDITSPYAELIVNAKILYPDHAHELYAADEQEAMRVYLIGLKAGNLKYYYKYLSHYKILFPEANIIEEFNISADELNAYDRRITEDLRRGKIDDAVYKAKEIRTAIPEHSVVKYFSQDDGKRLLAELINLKSDSPNWRKLSELATATKYLLAKNVDITDDGIKFGPMQNISSFIESTAPPLPETRNF